MEDAVNAAVRTALNIAVSTIPDESTTTQPAADADLRQVGKMPTLHKLSVAITGTAGGLLASPELALELPVTTTLMFRSIASIAREFGEDLSEPEVRLQCLTVFCLGGAGSSDDAMESAYTVAR